MPSTIKRISIALTKEDLRQLNQLSEFMGECSSDVIKRALIELHFSTFRNDYVAFKKEDYE